MLNPQEEKAVRELRRRRKNRALKEMYGPLTEKKGERFIRNDKARSWTERDERGETMERCAVLHGVVHSMRL